VRWGLEPFRIVADVGPTEPWFGLTIGVFFLCSLVATVWILFRGPRNPNRSGQAPRVDSR
jgi:hypothetical protein